MIGRPRAALGGALRVLALLLAVALARPAGAQDVRCDAGDREVRALRFAGNHAFAADELASVVATTPSTFLSRLRIVGTRRCLDPVEFPRDLLRLQAYYRKRGYPLATVDTIVRAVGPRAVAVTFRIVEGAPLRVDSVAVRGTAAVRDPRRTLPSFPLRPGSVFDRVLLEQARDSLRLRLRDAGYPAADALLQWSTDLARMTAAVEVTVVPGPFTRIGAIVVRRDTAGGRAEIPERVLRRTLGLRVGDPFSAGDIVEAQRTLYQTDAYRRVDVRVDTVGRAADSLVTLVVTVDEGDLNAARLSAGWASLDCFRMQADLTDRYFQPWAQRLELSARVSRIGIGRPLGGAPQLCPQARNDTYSDSLNYYVGATVRQPTLFRLRRVPSLTLFTSRQSEYNAFRRTIVAGGLLSLVSRPGSRLPSTVSYQLELGATSADPAVLCSIFSACDTTTQGLLLRRRALGALGYSLVRNRLDDPVNPGRGSVQRLTLRHSSRLTGSQRTQWFDKGVVDAAWYRPIGPEATLVGHVQLGAVFGAAPPQERLFAGGPTTVRGFRQNELGPVVYIVSSYDSTLVDPGTGSYLYAVPAGARPQRTVPAGGNTLVVGNVELTLRSPVLPNLLAFALFTDAGEVWNRGGTVVDDRGIRLTPGAGVRVRTLFGAIRVDLGYNPYPPAEGAAYYITPPGAGRQLLYCVSSGNGLPVVPGGPGVPGTQAAGSCPATYRPPASTSFFRRLNPSIWIGQAF